LARSAIELLTNVPKRLFCCFASMVFLPQCAAINYSGRVGGADEQNSADEPKSYKKGLFEDFRG
jgi:hypothetical protein